MIKMLSIFVLSMALVFPSYSFALDVAAGTAISGKTHHIELTGKNLELKPKFTTLDLNLTLVEGSFYARINYDQSIRDYVDNYQGSLLYNSRRDYGITLGYSVIKGLSIFVGHQTGITDMWNANLGSASDNFETEYRYEGPYMGLSYSLPVKSHSIGISVASADMNGSVTRKDPAIDSIGEENGDTTGLSYSLQLAGPFSDDIGYSIFIKVNEYEFKDTDGGEDLSSEERFDIIGISLTKYF